MEIELPNQQSKLLQKSKPTYLEQFIAEQKNKRLNFSENYLFLKVVIGKYFVQAFRAFKILPQLNSIIFWKRQKNLTHYNFFIVFQNFNGIKQDLVKLESQDKDPIKYMKKIVEKMTKKPLQNHSICLCLVKQMKKLNFTSQKKYRSFLQYLKYQPNQVLSQIMTSQQDPIHANMGQKVEKSQKSQKPQLEFQVQCLVPKLKKQDQEILFQSDKQFQALKQLISVYMDTFGNEEKGRYIYKQIEKSSGSFSVDLLLNTLNYIIYEEVSNSCYSQIEPCYWTCFQSSTKQLNSDRKHIVLTGSGEICVLEIIFLKGLETENKLEYCMMLTEFKKFYKKAKIKIYRITNEKWNGQVGQIALDEEPSNRNNSSVVTPSIIYKFDCPKTTGEYQQPKPKQGLYSRGK